MGGVASLGQAAWTMAVCWSFFAQGGGVVQGLVLTEMQVASCENYVIRNIELQKTMRVGDCCAEVSRFERRFFLKKKINPFAVKLGIFLQHFVFFDQFRFIIGTCWEWTRLCVHTSPNLTWWTNLWKVGFSYLGFLAIFGGRFSYTSKIHFFCWKGTQVGHDFYCLTLNMLCLANLRGQAIPHHSTHFPLTLGNPGPTLSWTCSDKHVGFTQGKCLGMQVPGGAVKRERQAGWSDRILERITPSLVLQ